MPAPAPTTAVSAPLSPQDLSVVIPCLVRRDEDARHLAACLDALAQAAPAPREIVLVDDGSRQPLTVPAGWSGAPMRVLRQSNAGPASARNAGALATSGSVIVFVDADIAVPVDVFARLCDRLRERPEAAAVWGTVTSEHPHDGFVSRYKNLTHRHFTLLQAEETRHLTTMLAAVRREAFLAVGGFDTRLRTVSVEDVELGRDLHDRGLPVLLDKELASVHHHRFTLLRALKNDFHKARNHARTTLDRRSRGESSVQVDGPGERRQLHYLVGVPLGAGAVAALLTGRWRLSAALLGGLAVWERELLTFLAKEEGPLFALGALPLMAVERTTVATAVAAGVADHLRGRLRGGVERPRLSEQPGRPPLPAPKDG